MSRGKGWRGMRVPTPAETIARRQELRDQGLSPREATRRAARERGEAAHAREEAFLVEEGHVPPAYPEPGEAERGAS